jgi:hypothetical protein
MKGGTVQVPRMEETQVPLHTYIHTHKTGVCAHHLSCSIYLHVEKENRTPLNTEQEHQQQIKDVAHHRHSFIAFTRYRRENNNRTGQKSAQLVMTRDFSPEEPPRRRRNEAARHMTSPEQAIRERKL